MLKFKEYLTEENKKVLNVDDLHNKLRKIAPGGIVAKHQAENDPDVHEITKHGKTFEHLHKDTHKMCGADGECHWNVGKLHAKGHIDNIGIGYAHNKHGWHQHTWGIKDNKVIETTKENLDNDKWHGKILNKSESAAFSKHVAEKGNYPGAGNVRTKKGGSIKEIHKKYNDKNGK